VRVPGLIIPVFLLLAATGRGEDRLWSAVLLASNAAQPKDPPAELAPVVARLKRIFGYNQFEVLGTDALPLTDGAELSPVPTKNFWMNLKARRASVKEARGGYLLNLELYQDKRALVDTIAMIAPGSPLFFRGPMHARGQILIVLQVLPEARPNPDSGAIKTAAPK
jgi:hypothetical protein